MVSPHALIVENGEYSNEPLAEAYLLPPLSTANVYSRDGYKQPHEETQPLRQQQHQQFSKTGMEGNIALPEVPAVKSVFRDW